MTDDEIKLFSELESHVTSAKHYARIASKSRDPDDRQRAKTHLAHIVRIAQALR
jgi:hypothetical protein